MGHAEDASARCGDYLGLNFSAIEANKTGEH